MADKQVPLSIIIRAVDRATAVVRKVNESVNRLSGVTTLRALGESLKGLAKESGLGTIAERIKGVGSAVKGVFGSIKNDLLGAGVGIGIVVHQLAAMIDEFDDLGDKAEKMGVTVDFLASMRYAAERSGAKVEQLDEGLKTLTQNIGQARAGTGRMVKFLQTVSPALLEQLKASKSTEAAFRLLADAMAKIPDPARRLALAQKTVGDTDLAPLLARGSAGLLELQGAFIGMAGSQEEAAAGAGAVDDSLKDLHAATQGIKAALIGGLSPALQQLVEELRAWFTENRERIAEWAKEFGQNLPDKIHNFVETLLSGVDKVSGFVDAIGGLKTVALAIAGVIAFPLIQTIVSLGVALYANPIILIITAIAVAALLIIKYWDPIKAFFRRLWDWVSSVFWKAWDFIKGLFLKYHPLGIIIAHWEPIKQFFGDLWDWIKDVFRRAWEYIKGIIDKVVGAVHWVTDKAGWLGRKLGLVPDIEVTPTSPAISQGALNAGTAAGAAAGAQAQLSVDFANTPRGTRVTASPANTTTVDMSLGYNLGWIGGP
jgi:hypothetical protein